MSTITRELIALDMLSQDMADSLDATSSNAIHQVSGSYLKLLRQYLRTMQRLAGLADNTTESGFCEAIATSQLCPHITNKRMLSVQMRLLEYVSDFYCVSCKARKIQEQDFSSDADKRLGLLQTRAIKAKTQFKTVARAMGKGEYQSFARGTALPEFDWSWDALGLAQVNGLA